ncbi:hypothetical protein [Hymenobacter volaticus]|uniref:Uncharacterized protein n=1 Tax=Hymenobacter volaticus TaxID=2932254 RepID=A0ABY4GF97_9BACT|nr:hypothetical protein [Hymenobacter volaticus]UOQ69527.1 hypothetical protein MUN86_28210 [Hymenobacter volaticus]
MRPGYRPPSAQWYNQPALVLLLCVLVLPVGLYGLWKSTTILPPIKAIVLGCLMYLLYHLATRAPW